MIFCYFTIFLRRIILLSYREKYFPTLTTGAPHPRIVSTQVRLPHKTTKTQTLFQSQRRGCRGGARRLSAPRTAVSLLPKEHLSYKKIFLPFGWRQSLDAMHCWVKTGGLDYGILVRCAVGLRGRRWNYKILVQCADTDNEKGTACFWRFL